MIGLKRQAAAVDIGAERAAERQPVGAGLLLDDAPLARLALLHGDETVDQVGPFDAGLDLDDAALCVETEDSTHRARVDEHAAGGELLTAHRSAVRRRC